MKKIKFCVVIFVLLLSLALNIVFLMQDTFNGTYYGKWLDGRNSTFSIHGQDAVFKLYNENGTVDRQVSCYYEVKEYVPGNTEIFITSISSDDVWERVSRNSIFAMPNFDRSSVYICPMAIVVQSIWAISDIVLLVFIIKELKKVLKFPKLRIVIEN